MLQRGPMSSGQWWSLCSQKELERRYVNPSYLIPNIVSLHINMLSSSNWRDDIKSLMDPSIGPTFWNDENHKDFKLTMVRPRKIPTVERKVKKWEKDVYQWENNHRNIRRSLINWLWKRVMNTQWNSIWMREMHSDSISQVLSYLLHYIYTNLQFHLFQGNGNFGFTIVMKENEEDDDVLSWVYYKKSEMSKKDTRFCRMRQAYPFFPFVPGPLSVSCVSHWRC